MYVRAYYEIKWNDMMRTAYEELKKQKRNYKWAAKKEANKRKNY